MTGYSLLKIGFNNIPLRAEHQTGIITSLLWYQWSLGIFYIALLLCLWNEPRTELAHLIYLK